MPMQCYMDDLLEVWKLGERPQGPGWRKTNLGSDTNLMQDEGCRPSYPINETRRPVDGAVGPIRSGVGPNDSRSIP